jgi:hypothetical protein
VRHTAKSSEFSQDLLTDPFCAFGPREHDRDGHCTKKPGDRPTVIAWIVPQGLKVKSVAIVLSFAERYLKPEPSEASGFSDCQSLKTKIGYASMTSSNLWGLVVASTFVMIRSDQPAQLTFAKRWALWPSNVEGGLFARARRRALNTVGNCRGLSAMRPTTLSISARKRPPRPGMAGILMMRPYAFCAAFNICGPLAVSTLPASNSLWT